MHKQGQRWRGYRVLTPQIEDMCAPSCTAGHGRELWNMAFPKPGKNSYLSVRIAQGYSTVFL